ncbi:hypothetical protein [Candidatus Liberibacter americanus]|nr:hypothetical protein [Candidatus Liberibacter americanus]
MLSTQRGFFIGADSGLWLCKMEGVKDIKDISVEYLSGFGSVSVPPVMVEKSCVFVQDSGRSLISVIYKNREGYQFNDLNILAEHMMLRGVKEISFQHSPYSIIWVLRTDGELVGCTFDPENGICAWHSHSLGGKDSKVCSLNSFSNFIRGQDELWLLVERKAPQGEVIQSLERLGDFQRANTYQAIDMIDGLAGIEQNNRKMS